MPAEFGYIINTAQAKDLPAIEKITLESFPDSPWGTDYFRYVVCESQDPLFRVAREESGLATAYILPSILELRGRNDPYGYIEYLAVSKDHQRKGLGKSLLQAGINAILEVNPNIKAIALHTRVSNIPMQELALKMGFIRKVLLLGIYSPEDGYEMQKILEKGYQFQIL